MNATDTRYVTSVACTWHGPITEVGSTMPRNINVNGRTIKGHSLPWCPHCASMLMENATRAEFDAGARRFMNEQMAGDQVYLAWLQSLHDSGTCRPTKDWDWRADFAAFKAQQS